MIKDVMYAFNKRDYFNYFFLSVVLYIFFDKINVITNANILTILLTGAILYFLINKKILRDYSKMQKYNDKLKIINVSRYKFITKDVYIVDCIIKLDNLSRINRVKFNKFLNYTNKFFMYYRMSKAKNLIPSDIYQAAYDNSTRAINTLLSFVVDINEYAFLDNDRQISNDDVILVNNNIDSCIKTIKDRFNIFLTEIEKKINNDWKDEEKINIFSKPIYPDDITNNVETDVLFSNKFNII